MNTLLSDKQKELFLSISGIPFKGNELAGNFFTEFPYNNREYNLSPWLFHYVIESETGNLICELSHRMTNNRIYGWDRDGDGLSVEITSKYFIPHF